VPMTLKAPADIDSASAARFLSPSASRVEVAGTEGPAIRHATATLMLGHGVRPKPVSGMVGDSTIAITVDPYCRATPAMHPLGGEDPRSPTPKDARLSLVSDHGGAVCPALFGAARRGEPTVDFTW
jgi:hypothetical protein